jgi:CRP-like cAMP-binding protein
MTEPRHPSEEHDVDGRARAVLRQRFQLAAPEALELLLRRAILHEYPAKAVLCYQGEQEERFSIIVDGQLDIYMDQATGRTFVAYLRAGRSLGGLEYITRTPRVADAVAAEPVTVLEMSFEDLDTVVRSEPEILHEISREVVTELLESQDRFIRLSAASATDAGEHEVFISYARADAEFAKKLATGLRRLGIAVWLDVYSITAGKSWARQVGDALDRCEVMLLIVSPRSMASENSDDEWNYFLDKKKPVIPAMYEHADVRYRLNKLQYVDFTTQPFDSALTQLAVAIRGAIATGQR